MVLEVFQSAEVIATMPRSHLQAECQLLRAREGSCRLERTMSARRDQRLTVVDLRDIRCQADGEREPEVLAHHFTQAGLTDAAIEWWGKAGDQALHRSAYVEAIGHLGKAIAASMDPTENSLDLTGRPALPISPRWLQVHVP